jgi:hypothetical protein
MKQDLCEQIKACLHQEVPLLLYAGAGISKDAGMPLWTEAACKSLTYAREKGGPKLAPFFESVPLDDLPFVFECIKRKLSEPIYHQILEDVFKRDLQPSNTHKALVSIDALGIITTNYDRLIEHAYAEIRKSAPTVFLNDLDSIRSLIRSPNDFVFKMHGDVTSVQRMICSTSDYKEYYKSEALNSLFTLFAATTQFVFIGFSFSDPDFIALWRKVSQVTYSKRPPLLIGHDDDFSSELRAEIRRLGIHVVSYDSPVGDYSKTLEALHCLAKARPREMPVPRIQVDLPSDPDLIRNILHALLVFYDDRAQTPTRWLLSSIIAHHLYMLPVTKSLAQVDLEGKVLTQLGTRATRWEEEIIATLSILITTEVVEKAPNGQLKLTHTARTILSTKQERSRGQVDALLHRAWDRAKLKHRNIDPLSPELLKKSETALVDLIQQVGRTLAQWILYSSYTPEEYRLLDKTILALNILGGGAETVREILREVAFHTERDDQQILFELFQAGFLVSAYVLNPDAEKYLREEISRYSVYVDSHVVLEALPTCHSGNDTYRQILRKTKSLGMDVLITPGFVEEVYSHYRIADDELSHYLNTHISTRDAVEAYCAIAGDRAANAFLLGFRNWIISGGTGEWDAYSKAIFGIDDKTAITKDVVQYSIQRILDIRCDTTSLTPESTKCISAIAERIGYIRKLDGTFRTNKVCEHDAYQFLLIYDRRAKEPALSDKVWFITNDSVLYRLFEGDKTRYTLPPTYTPLRWAQYLDAIEFEPRSATRFGRLFGMAQSALMDDTAARELLRDAIEREHEIFKKGIASIKEFVNHLILDFHLKEASEAYMKARGKGEKSKAQQAKQEMKDRVKEVLDEFVGMKKTDYTALQDKLRMTRERSETLERELRQERFKRAALKGTIDSLNQELGKKPRRKKRRRRIR